MFKSNCTVQETTPDGYVYFSKVSWLGYSDVECLEMGISIFCPFW